MDMKAVKHVVLDTGLREGDIRPPEIFGRFAALCAQECPEFFADRAAFTDSPCPGCGSDRLAPLAVKNGFTYNGCANCGTFHVSPRPSEEMLTAFRERSKSYEYKVSRFIPSGAAARRHHLVGSLAQWLAGLTLTHGDPEAGLFLDVLPVSTVLMEEVMATGRFARCAAYRPHPLLREPFADLGVEVVDSLKELEGQVGAAAGTELLESLHSPAELLRMLAGALAPRGMLFLTTRTSTGFDLSVLGPAAPYVFVPEHLNLLSEKGVEALLSATGFRAVELSTPGQLDVQFVAEALKAAPDTPLPAFARTLVVERGEGAHHDFQTFLQKHQLSSHLRLAAIRRDGSG